MVEPGARVLHLAGERVLSTVTDLVVPPSGLHIKVHAPSTRKASNGAGLIVLGVGA